VTEKNSVKGVHQITCYPSLKTEAEPTSETSCFITN